MYRSDLGATHRSGAIIAAAAVNAAMLLAFLQMSGKIDLAEPQSALRVFDIGQKPPPPPPPPPPLVAMIGGPVSLYALSEVKPPVGFARSAMIEKVALAEGLVL